MSAESAPVLPEPTPAQAAQQRRALRMQILVTTSLLWVGFSVIAWFLRFKFWSIFGKDDVPAFSRAVFSLHPLIPSVAVLAGLILWSVLHLRIRSTPVRQGVAFGMLALWCLAAGVLCLAFFAPLTSLRVNL